MATITIGGAASAVSAGALYLANTFEARRLPLIGRGIGLVLVATGVLGIASLSMQVGVLVSSEAAGLGALGWGTVATGVLGLLTVLDGIQEAKGLGGR